MSAAHTRIQLQLARAGGFRLDVDLHLPAQGITVLFGPSGSGKTTVLRCVAGLERADSARIDIAGECWQDRATGVFLPTWQRPLGYVFQEASLFDHLDVQANLHFGLRRAGRLSRATPAGAGLSLEAAIGLLGIGHLLSRRTHELSGGERQRVAIARALATQPRVLLLDEPLSSLDRSRQQDILPWLERLRDELHIPMLYVTHSADEMARLADTLVLMEHGRAVACGPSDQVMLRTELQALSGRDAGALLHGRIEERDAAWQLMRVKLPGGSLWMPDSGGAPGQAVRVRLLARDVGIATERPRHTSLQNLLACSVAEMSARQQDGQVLVRLVCDDDRAEGGSGAVLLARITARAAHALALAPGLRVWALVKAANLL